jgi:uncharacterized membrane protein YvlD (DUF360 family)
MITALLLGLIRTAIQGVYLLLTTLLSTVFSNYTSAMSAIVSSVPVKVAAGIIDTVVGWTFFTGWVVLALVVLPLVRLAKYIIGFFTKG